MAVLGTGGLTIPAHGVGGSWIVKVPSAQFAAVPENEFVMLELARAVGLQVLTVRLLPVADIRGLPTDIARMKGSALAVERFDRAGGCRRIHMEDFAQVFGLFPEDKCGHRSYANIASVLWAEAGEADTYEFIRRLVFSVLIGNADMHLKNWSLLYPDGRAPILSPAYDFVSTLPYYPRRQRGPRKALVHFVPAALPAVRSAAFLVGELLLGRSASGRVVVPQHYQGGRQSSGRRHVFRPVGCEVEVRHHP